VLCDFPLPYTQQGCKLIQHFIVKVTIAGLSGLLMDVFALMGASDSSRSFFQCLLEHVDLPIQSLQDIHHYFLSCPSGATFDLSN